MDKGNCWNTEDTCTYKQTILVNPLIGGFNPYAGTLEESKFTSYQFFGDYKVSANNNKVIIYTTNSCSQMSISFDYGCVIFQSKVKPQKRNTECKQVVDFQEQRYTIEIDPFTRETVEVVLVIFATGSNLNFYRIDLKSLTDESIIAAQFYEFVTEHLPVNGPVSDDDETLIRGIVVNPDITSLIFDMNPKNYSTSKGLIKQDITLSTFNAPPLVTTQFFVQWQLRNSTGKLLKSSSKSRSSYTFNVSGATGTTFRIGFLYNFQSTNYFFGTTITLPVLPSNASIIGSYGFV